MSFDIQRARQDGYSDVEIADFLSAQRGFNAAGARQDGYTDADIIGELSGAGQELDRSTGASYGARFAIGSAADDTTKLARARDYLGSSAQQERDGGISFINPETGRRTLVNPEGFDLGDIAGAGREIFSTLASVPAAIGGGIAGGGIGSLATGSLAASAAGAGAGQLVDSGAAWLARREAEKRGATPSPMQSPADAAKEAAWETGLGTVGGVALGTAGRAASKAFNPMKEEIVQAYKNLNLQIPSIAAASSSRAPAMVESAIGDTITGSGVIKKAQEFGAQNLQDALDTVATRIGSGPTAATPYELGELAKEAAARSKDAFKRRSEQTFDELSRKWGGQKAKLTNTQRAIDELEQSLMYNGQPTHTSNALRQQLVGLIENELADNQYGLLTLQGVQGARGRLRNMLRTPGAFNTADMGEGQIKYLRNALKSDYRAAITDPAELAKLDAHNQWYAQQKGMRDTLDGILGKEDAQRLGEALLRADMTPDTVQMLEQTLLPSDFAAIRGGVIRQLGRPLASSGMEPGQASAAGVSKLLGAGKGAYAPETQAALFGPDLNDVRTIAQGMAGAGKTYNTSRTASINELLRLMRSPAQWAQGGAAMLDPITSAVAPYAVGKLNTSPAVVNYLARPQSEVSRALNNVLAPISGVNAGQYGTPGSAHAAQSAPADPALLESVLDPEYAMRVTREGQAAIPGYTPGMPTAGQQLTFQQMLNRMGITTSLDKKGDTQ